jgi:hypothetical protein
MATVFFSYSHKDEALRDELEVHLAMLKREGSIETWHDRKILAGGVLDRSISDNLERADVILLLVSPDFLASAYCYDVEVNRAMQRHAESKACVIPVILRPCDWQKAPFGQLLAAPKDGKPVTKWTDRDEAFLNVTRYIRDALPTKKKAASSVSSPAVAPISVSHSKPRSSNLRLRKDFSEADKDRFLDDTFEYLATFFENSLSELSERNSAIEFRFKRINAQSFSAAIYVHGKKVSYCNIRNVGSRSGGGITYSSDERSEGNSFNESLRVEATDQALFLKSLGMASIVVHREKDSHLTMEGAAECYWAMLIERLQ